MRRYLPPPTLVTAIALLLIAPALVYHVSSTPNSEARDLEALSAGVPEVRVNGPVTSPTSVEIVAENPFVDATGASTTQESVLVRVSVTRLTPPEVGVQVRLPGEVTLAPSVKIAGVPVVTESVDGTRVDVRDGASTPFSALVDAGSGSVRVTWRGDDGERVRVEHVGAGTGAVVDGNDHLTRLIVHDPVDPSAPALVAVESTPSGARFTLLGNVVEVPGGHAEGDPFEEDGAVIRDDSGLALLVVRAHAPDALGAPVTIGFEGPALEEVLPGAASATLTMDVSRVPFGVAALTIAGKTAGTDRALVLAADTGLPLIELFNGTAGATLASVHAGLNESLANAPAEFEQVPGDGHAIIIKGRVGGEDVVEVRVTPGATDVVTVHHTRIPDAPASEDSPESSDDPDAQDGQESTDAPGLPGVPDAPGTPGTPEAPGTPSAPGTPDATLLVNTATGLVAGVQGDPEAPDAVTLATTAGSPLVTAEPVPGGGFLVAWPGVPGDAPLHVPDGRLRLAADPSGLAPWELRVDADGAPVVTAVVDRAALVPGAAGLGRPVITVDAPSTAKTVTLAPPVAIEGDLSQNRVTAVTLLDPMAPETPLARAEATPTGWTFTTPLGAHSTSENDLTVPSNALTADVVTFAAGEDSLTVDRRSGTAIVDAGDAPVRVRGPVTVAGDPTNPDAVRVTNPQDPGTPLLRYSRGGSLLVLGEEHAFNARAVTFEGDARSPHGFALVVTSPDGTVEERHEVRPRALMADAGVPGDLRDALLTVIESGNADPRYVTHVADARGNLVPGDALVNASGTIALAGPHEARVDVPRATGGFTRVLMEAWTAGAADAATRAVLPRAADAGDAFVHAGAFTPPAADGQVVHALVRYETEVTPFARRAVEETGLAYRVDGAGPRAVVNAPASSASARFTVTWEGADAEAPVAFEVQKRALEGAWSTWLALTSDASAAFTGDPGAAYAFRARGVDALGNVGAWSTPVTVRVTEDAPAASASALSATLTAPAPGSVLTGVVSVEWAPVPEGAQVNLYASRDGGRSWKSLYAGTGASFAWDTRGERDGAWSLRLVVTDGRSEAEDVVSGVTLGNTGVAAAHVTDASAQSAGAGDAGSGDAGADGASGTSEDGAGRDGGTLARLALTGAGFVAAAILVVIGVVVGKRRR